MASGDLTSGNCPFKFFLCLLQQHWTSVLLPDRKSQTWRQLGWLSDVTTFCCDLRSSSAFLWRYDSSSFLAPYYGSLLSTTIQIVVVWKEVFQVIRPPSSNLSGLAPLPLSFQVKEEVGVWVSLEGSFMQQIQGSKESVNSWNTEVKIYKNMR